MRTEKQVLSLEANFQFFPFDCKARFLSLTHASKGENSLSWHHRVIFASYSIVSRKYIRCNCPATITAYFGDIFPFGLSISEQALSFCLQHICSDLSWPKLEGFITLLIQNVSERHFFFRSSPWHAKVPGSGIKPKPQQ